MRLDPPVRTDTKTPAVSKNELDPVDSSATDPDLDLVPAAVVAVASAADPAAAVVAAVSAVDPAAQAVAVVTEENLAVAVATRADLAAAVAATRVDPAAAVEKAAAIAAIPAVAAGVNKSRS